MSGKAPPEHVRDRARRWPLPLRGLRYQKAWWMSQLLGADNGYIYWRSGRYAGMVVRYGRTWFAAAPDPEGTYLLTDGGDFRRYRTRDAATLALATYAEGLLA